MSTLSQRWNDLLKKVLKTETKMPARFAILDDHVDIKEKLSSEFQPDEHYFEVRINEMFLDNSRGLWNTYDPVVFVVSEFTYDKSTETIPFLVGPMMMEKLGEKMPLGMIFSDTRVAGVSPYRGDRLNLSVILFRSKYEDYARKLLQIVEGAANALTFSYDLAPYLKIANVVVDGVETMLGLGNMQPIVGLRKEFDPDAGDLLKPGYFALINTPEEKLERERFWVRNNQLVYGNSLQDAAPFRDADYVLYSITQNTTRGDVTKLPFYKLWEMVKKDASFADETSWTRTKAELLALYQSMLLSPDLTPQHVDELYEKYKKDMVSIHEKAIEIIKKRKLSKKERSLKTKLDEATVKIMEP